MEEQPSTSNTPSESIKEKREILNSDQKLHKTSLYSEFDTSQDFPKSIDTSFEEFFAALPDPDQVPHSQDFIDLYDATYKSKNQISTKGKKSKLGVREKSPIRDQISNLKREIEKDSSERDIRALFKDLVVSLDQLNKKQQELEVLKSVI